MTEDKKINSILNAKWYLLEQPWAHSSNAGTTILAGNPDPHVAEIVADTEMMMDGTDEEFTMSRARAIAEHIVHIHNSKLDEQEWQPCSDCDGHDACWDFGCAIEQGIIEPDKL